MSNPESSLDETRPASLWPDSLRAPRSSSFPITRFDAAAEERARSEAQTAAAFDVCHPALALRALLLVQAVLVVAALALSTNLADWGQRQAGSTFGGVAATLVWLVAVCGAKKGLRRARPAPRAALVLALGAIAALIGWLPLWGLGLAAAAGGLRPLAIGLAGAGLAAMLWAWLELRARIWHPANVQARLAELQSRIRPHFLFNALNTALALVRSDPARAETVLEDLAQLFRVALADTGTSVALEEEISLARAYLAIEEVRFGSRMSVEWEVDPACAEARVPPLVLQPLVENAVRHGVEPAAAGARIAVRAEARHGQVLLTVSNTVPDEPSSPGHGMALHNIRERLRLLHDVAAQCEVWREGDQFHARIVLPLP
ncbi:MAG: histidine kinase [Burkholderiales bacterium]|nr:histidine kinase [Burkholderiales bacterium]MDE2457480.1 histidine kinase [Burkholderiales bacterium]